MLQNMIRGAGFFYPPPFIRNWVYSSYFVKWEKSCKLFFSCFREEKSQQHNLAVYFDIHSSKNSYLQQFVTSNMHFLLWTYPKILKGSLIKPAESLNMNVTIFNKFKELKIEPRPQRHWSSWLSEKTFVSAQRYFITVYFTVLLICNKK